MSTPHAPADGAIDALDVVVGQEDEATRAATLAAAGSCNLGVDAQRERGDVVWDAGAEPLGGKDLAQGGHTGLNDAPPVVDDGEDRHLLNDFGAAVW
jgi:hypothetical protein